MENNNNTQIQVVNSADQIVSASPFSNNNSFFFCSIPDDGSRESKVSIYNAMNDVDENVADHLNEELLITDVIAHNIQLLDELTGELVDTVRVVLVGADGTNYQAVSKGVVSSLQKIFGLVGQPSWKENPIKVVPKQKKVRNGFKTVVLSLGV